KRLYRETHGSFEEYCREKFGHSRQKSDYLIVGANIYENLTSNRCQIRRSSNPGNSFTEISTYLVEHLPLKVINYN
ncbi:MAG: hypothetical protein AAGF26_19740, partial [Cyanobacteria bacterium P01_G01_bin.49]